MDIKFLYHLLQACEYLEDYLKVKVKYAYEYVAYEDWHDESGIGVQQKLVADGKFRFSNTNLHKPKTSVGHNRSIAFISQNAV